MSAGTNGGSGPRPVDDRDVRIAQLEKRCAELMHQVEELTKALNKREGQLQAHRGVNAVQGRHTAELRSALGTLIDYLDDKADTYVLPEHLAVYIDGARKVLEGRR